MKKDQVVLEIEPPAPGEYRSKCSSGVTKVRFGGYTGTIKVAARENRCEIFEQNLALEDGKVICPTPTPTLAPTMTMIPKPEPIHIVENQFLYQAQQGDTLEPIAEKFLVPVELLIETNNLDEKNPVVLPGTSFTIPCSNQECICNLPGPDTNIPAYYQPNPALHWVASLYPPRKQTPIQSISWIDNTHVKGSTSWYRDRCHRDSVDFSELPINSMEIRKTSSEPLSAPE